MVHVLKLQYVAHFLSFPFFGVEQQMILLTGSKNPTLIMRASKFVHARLLKHIVLVTNHPPWPLFVIKILFIHSYDNTYRMHSANMHIAVPFTCAYAMCDRLRLL